MTAGNAGRDVVLISADTLRYDCVGLCPGKTHLASWGFESRVDTPNLDVFLSESAYFPQCMTTAPYTTAAHASVMTGLYPNRHGMRAFYKWALAENVRTLAERLKGMGYATAAVQESGQSSALRTGSGVLRGFDEFFADDVPACAWCAEQDGPRLLFVHTFDVHVPYCWSAVPDVQARADAWPEVTREILGRLKVKRDEMPADKTQFQRRTAELARRKLGGEETAWLLLDWYIRGVNWFDRVRWPRLLKALRGASLYEDALIVLFADHGEAVMLDTAGTPLNHGSALLEDVIRVPLAVRGPGVEPGIDERPVSLADVAPTVLEWLGVEADDMDGRSLLEEAAERIRFAETWRAYGRAELSHPARRIFRDLGAPCVPAQACARRGAIKVLWHPASPTLERFMSPAGKAGNVGKRMLKKVLPRAAVNWLRRLRAKPNSTAGADRAPTGWRDAPTFLLDLEADPLETNPRRIEDAPPEEAKELLDALREYWQAGVTGPPIKLETTEGEKVMEHLKGLGYVD